MKPFTHFHSDRRFSEKPERAASQRARRVPPLPLEKSQFFEEATPASCASAAVQPPHLLLVERFDAGSESDADRVRFVPAGGDRRGQLPERAGVARCSAQAARAPPRRRRRPRLDRASRRSRRAAFGGVLLLRVVVRSTSRSSSASRRAVLPIVGTNGAALPTSRCPRARCARIVARRARARALAAAGRAAARDGGPGAPFASVVVSASFACPYPVGREPGPRRRAHRAVRRARRNALAAAPAAEPRAGRGEPPRAPDLARLAGGGARRGSGTRVAPAQQTAARPRRRPRRAARPRSSPRRTGAANREVGGARADAKRARGRASAARLGARRRGGRTHPQGGRRRAPRGAGGPGRGPPAATAARGRCAVEVLEAVGSRAEAPNRGGASAAAVRLATRRRVAPPHAAEPRRLGVPATRARGFGCGFCGARYLAPPPPPPRPATWRCRRPSTSARCSPEAAWRAAWRVGGVRRPHAGSPSSRRPSRRRRRARRPTRRRGDSEELHLKSLRAEVLLSRFSCGPTVLLLEPREEERCPRTAAEELVEAVEAARGTRGRGSQLVELLHDAQLERLALRERHEADGTSPSATRARSSCAHLTHLVRVVGVEAHELGGASRAERARGVAQSSGARRAAAARARADRRGARVL